MPQAGPHARQHVLYAFAHQAQTMHRSRWAALHTSYKRSGLAPKYPAHLQALAVLDAQHWLSWVEEQQTLWNIAGSTCTRQSQHSTRQLQVPHLWHWMAGSSTYWLGAEQHGAGRTRHGQPCTRT